MSSFFEILKEFGDPMGRGEERERERKEKGVNNTGKRQKKKKNKYYSRKYKTTFIRGQYNREVISDTT